MVNGLTDFAGQRGHQELCASSSAMMLDRHRIIDVQKDIQPFTAVTAELKEMFSKAATSMLYYLFTSVYATYNTCVCMCLRHFSQLYDNT